MSERFLAVNVGVACRNTIPQRIRPLHPAGFPAPLAQAADKRRARPCSGADAHFRTYTIYKRILLTNQGQKTLLSHYLITRKE